MRISYLPTYLSTTRHINLPLHVPLDRVVPSYRTIGIESFESDWRNIEELSTPQRTTTQHSPVLKLTRGFYVDELSYGIEIFVRLWRERLGINRYCGLRKVYFKRRKRFCYRRLFICAEKRKLRTNGEYILQLRFGFVDLKSEVFGIYKTIRQIRS